MEQLLILIRHLLDSRVFVIPDIIEYLARVHHQARTHDRDAKKFVGTVGEDTRA